MAELRSAVVLGIGLQILGQRAISKPRFFGVHAGMVTIDGFGALHALQTTFEHPGLRTEQRDSDATEQTSYVLYVLKVSDCEVQ